MKRIVIFLLLITLSVFNGCEQSINISNDILNTENGLNVQLIHEALLQRNWNSYLVLFGFSEEFDMKEDQSITVKVKNLSSHEGTWKLDRKTFTYTCTFNHNNPAWAKVFIFTPISISSREGTYQLGVTYSIYYLNNDEPESSEIDLYLR